MEVGSPQMSLPTSFCCNCGDLNCVNEIQNTRVTRYFGIGGTETTFHLLVPICARCRRTTKRRPPGFFARLLVLALMLAVVFPGLLALGAAVTFPEWLAANLFWVSLGLAIALSIVLWRLRRPKPPQTSFYQPVRIKKADVAVSDLANSSGRVMFMKLAFTNPDYLEVFRSANADSIKAGSIAAVKA